MPARTDNVRDPALAADLLLMRRGQAYFARKLNELRADEFGALARVPGWSRARVVADVGYRARGLAEALGELSAGAATVAMPPQEELDERARFGASLPVEALRNLAFHAAVHLNVAWRDLPEPSWRSSVTLSDGSVVTAADTVRLRAREVWSRAVDLGNGGLPADIPAELSRPSS